MYLLGYGQRCSIAGSDGRICCDCKGFVPKVVRVWPKHHMHTPEERSRTFGAHSQRILNSVRHQVELICVSILEKQNGVHFWTQQVTRHAQTYAHTHAGFVPKEVRV